MDRKELNRLNSTLRRDIGSNPYGEPLFKWCWSQELKAFSPATVDWVADKQSGLLQIEHTCEEYSQVEGEPHWVIARWFPATPEEWSAAFKNAVPFPTRGWYCLVNIELEPGVEPDADKTEKVVHRLRHHFAKTLADFDREGEEIVARRKKKTLTEQDDILRDLTFVGDCPPGIRGGPISFGGYEGDKE